MTLGQVGIWRRRQEGTGAVAEIEALGFTALWVGGSPSLAEVRPFLEKSSTLTVATGILNVWQHDPPDVAAALGPKMLELAAQRSLGTHTYFATVEHTRFAREHVGPDALVAPEVAVVVETDAEAARRAAREYAALYLGRRNYTNNLLRFGFTERDIADGGSDRFIDAVIPHGSPEQIADAVRAHLDAGADHVALQPLGHGSAPVADYEALAGALL